MLLVLPTLRPGLLADGRIAADTLPAQQSLDQSAVTVPYSSAPDYLDAGLQNVLDSYVDNAGGDWAVSVKKLDTGQYAGVNAHTQTVTASLYKVLVMYSVMRQSNLGNLNLDDTAEITDINASEDTASGELRWAVGSQVKISTLLNSMITVSDNTAGSTLANLVGIDRINDDMQRLGLVNTSLNFSGDNVTNAAEYNRLLEWIATSQVIDRATCRAMIDLMLQQQLNDELPAGLPDGTPIAHKTGSLDNLQHDAGIVYGPSGPYVITVMSWNLPDYQTSTDVMRNLSAAVYNYFNGHRTVSARYFPETQQVVRPSFLLYYNTNGGRPIFGLPISPEITDGGRTVQYFERARMERPAGGGPVGLGLVGQELTSARGLHFDATSPANLRDTNTQWFPSTRQAIGQPFLGYWREHGAETLFGLPISNIVIETHDGRQYRVQYFQRARFELHGDGIQLGLIGSELYALKQ